MRSYIKCYRSPDFRTLIYWRQGLDITGYEKLELVRQRIGHRVAGIQPGFCQVYTKLNQAATIRYFDANGTELDLGNYGSALTLTNIIYDLRAFKFHPDN